MNIEKMLAWILKEKMRGEVYRKNWSKSKKFRKVLQEFYEKSDFTPGELCEVLEVDPEELAVMLNDRGLNRKPQHCVWKENFDRKLPLFVPIHLTGIDAC
jgi:hypothetical protein